MTPTRMRSTSKHLERYTLYLALFHTQDSVYTSPHSSVHWDKNKEHGMPWTVPLLGSLAYEASIILLESFEC
jgi:hypothetical protein